MATKQFPLNLNISGHRRPAPSLPLPKSSKERLSDRGACSMSMDPWMPSHGPEGLKACRAMSRGPDDSKGRVVISGLTRHEARAVWSLKLSGSEWNKGLQARQTVVHKEALLDTPHWLSIANTEAAITAPFPSFSLLDVPSITVQHDFVQRVIAAASSTSRIP